MGEKATLPAKITALGEAGHASTPTAGNNAVPLLAQLVQRLGRHQIKPTLLPETRRTLEILVGDIGDDLEHAIQKAVALHPSFFSDLMPLFKTTIAPTMLGGSTALNVMPGRASVTCDCRVLPGTGPPNSSASFAPLSARTSPTSSSSWSPPRAAPWPR
ncbi:MAG: peptidase dimerization domain-containing protein [Actinomycetota bacterium]